MKALSIEEVELAREKLFSNAESLFSESELLYQHGFYPRAYSLAHFCCEELAKIPMLVGAGLDIVNGETVDWKKLNKRLINHKEKIKAGFVHDYFFSEVRADDSDLKEHLEAMETVGLVNDMKNNSLYAGLVKGQFVKPAGIVNKDIVEQMMQLTRTRLNVMKKIESSTLGKLSKSKTAATLRRHAKHMSSDFKKNNC